MQLAKQHNKKNFSRKKFRTTLTKNFLSKSPARLKHTI